MRSLGSEEGKKGGRKQSIPGKTCRKGDAISGRDGEVWGGGWLSGFSFTFVSFISLGMASR